MKQLGGWLSMMTSIRAFADLLGVPDGHVYPIIGASSRTVKCWYVSGHGFYRGAHPASWMGRLAGGWVAYIHGRAPE